MNKNSKTFLGAALSALLLMTLVPYTAQAVNAPDAVQNEVDKTPVARMVRGGADVSKAVNLFYVGAATDTTVAISATAMTFYNGGTLDSTVGTSGVITYASTLASNTMGALCDYLNGIGNSITNYRCKLLDSKRDDPPVILKTQTQTTATNDLKAAGGFSIPITTVTIMSIGINPAQDKRIVLRHCQTNNQDAGTGTSVGNNLFVYGQLRKFGNGQDRVNMGIACIPGGACQNGAAIVGSAQDDTDEVYRSSSTQNTTMHQPPLTGYVDSFMEFAPNAHVVVRAGSLGGLGIAAQTANNWLGCEWWEK